MNVLHSGAVRFLKRLGDLHCSEFHIRIVLFQVSRVGGGHDKRVRQKCHRSRGNEVRFEPQYCKGSLPTVGQLPLLPSYILERFDGLAVAARAPFPNAWREQRQAPLPGNQIRAG